METKTKTCDICGRSLPLSAFSKSYKGRCKECVARQTKEKRSGMKTEYHNKHIDWEQRRYEIAKDVLAGMLAGQVLHCSLKAANGYFSNVPPQQAAVWYADALIYTLKHQKELEISE